MMERFLSAFFSLFILKKEILRHSGITASITYTIYMRNALPIPHSSLTSSPPNTLLTALASARVPFSPSSALLPTKIAPS